MKSVSENDDAIVVRLRAAHHALAPPVVDDRLRRLGARTVEAIERAGGNVAVELRAVGRHSRKPSNTSSGRPPGFDSVWTMIGGTAPISTALATRLRRGGRRSGDLAAAGRVADVDGVLEIEVRGQRGQVVRVGVHVVPVPVWVERPWPRRSWAMTR